MQKSREDTNISKCTYPLHHTYNYRGENYYFLNLYSQKMENFNKDNILWHSLFRRPTFLFAYDLLDASCKTCVGRDSEQLNLCTLSPPLTTLKISRISSNVSSSQDKKIPVSCGHKPSISLKNVPFSKIFSSCYIVSEPRDLNCTWCKMLVSHERTKWQKGCHLFNSLILY